MFHPWYCGYKHAIPTHVHLLFSAMMCCRTWAVTELCPDIASLRYVVSSTFETIVLGELFVYYYRWIGRVVIVVAFPHMYISIRTMKIIFRKNTNQSESRHSLKLRGLTSLASGISKRWLSSICTLGLGCFRDEAWSEVFPLDIGCGMGLERWAGHI